MVILQIKSVKYFAPLLTLLFILIGCNSKYENLDLKMYQYRDTKDLVKFVFNASKLLEKEGLSCLSHFKSNRKFYNNQDYYLYIFSIDGKNIYHAGMPNLEGKNLWNIKDIEGKKITQQILSALDDKNNPHAWVHYSWWQPGKFYPVPKSSCHFKVTTPEGKDFYVGGGLNYPHEEKEFIRIVVDSAAELLNKQGENALPKISDPTSMYNYREVKVFVFLANGKTLISPVVTQGLAEMELLQCSDDVGHKPFIKALKKLKNRETTWEVFMAKNRYIRKLTKKCLYIRKTTMSGKEVFVAAITDLPQPL